MTERVAVARTDMVEDEVIIGLLSLITALWVVENIITLIVADSKRQN